jgi:ABC-type transport system involved in multi-copper enzyme maturation permease subunit
MIFATLITEREPFQWSDLPAGALTWVQDAGGFAAVALTIWLVAYWLRYPASATSGRHRPWQPKLFGIALAVALLGYAAALAIGLLGGSEPPLPSTAGKSSVLPQDLQSICLLVAGACALFALCLPFVLDLLQMRWRRVWALAKLSFKDAIRRRVLWVFSAMLLVFMFASWFLDYKPENQVRNYVRVIYWGMTPLLLFTAALLAAFSIPADVKNQTIHTIVTKPVERFEIVLGRFLGYVLLMSIVLAVMTAFSLLYVLRGIDPEAAEESLKARVPLYGNLTFVGTAGDSVGREWDYRKYIAGGSNSKHRAVWRFEELPPDLATRKDKVRCEFAFDIFRTTKGEENKGVFCTFTFQTWHWDPKQQDEYNQERERELSKPGANPDEVTDRLARKYGYYQFPSKEVVDYHTLSIDVPPGLFENALEGAAQRPADPDNPGQKVPEMQLFVKCESRTQYLGVAKHDLYLLDSEKSFQGNFFKGAVGLWLRLCLVIGLAVCTSTYFSGIISFFLTAILYGLGTIQEFIQSLAQGTAIGGGPFEALIRTVNREALVTKLEQTPGVQFALWGDKFFRVVFHVILDIIPDVDRFDFTQYVAEGFDITGSKLFLHVLLLIGYLVPFAILGYYLLKSREVAA